MTHPFLLMYGGGDEGGAVEYLLHLMATVDRAELKPVFVSMGRDRLRSAVEQTGAEYRVAGSPWAVTRVARETGARFFHTHGVRANFAGRVAGLMASLPTVTTVHSMISLDYVSIPMRVAATLMDNATLPLVTRVIAISEAIAADVIRRGVKPSKVTVVHNGVSPAPPVDRAEVRAELGVDSKTVAIGVLSRLHPVKGLFDLLDAAASLGEEVPRWQIFIAGDGPLRVPLEQRVRCLHLDEKVSFLGHVQGGRRLLAGFDLYVSASLMEGLGLSVMEAMAAQLPIVATAVGGVKELLADGRTGLLVPPSDSRSLAKAIRRVLVEPGLGRQIGEAAYQRYQDHFTVQQFARRTEAVYRELLQ